MVGLSEAAYRFKVHSGTCVVSHNGTDPRLHHYMHIQGWETIDELSQQENCRV